jgi:hypothetical protein
MRGHELVDGRARRQSPGPTNMDCTGARVCLPLVLKPVKQREVMHYVTGRYSVSTRRACRVIMTTKSGVHREQRQPATAPNDIWRIVFRISFVRRSSKFSLSSCVRRASSSVVRPARWPASRFACAPADGAPRRCIRASRQRRNRRPLGAVLSGLFLHQPNSAHGARVSTCVVVPWATSSLGMGPR